MNSELELIDRTRNGDLSAFRELVEENKKRVYYIALDYTGNREDAEDISQEVFISAFRSIDKFRGDSKFSTWLHRITINKCINLKRKKSYNAMKPSENMNEINEQNENYHENKQNINPEKFAEAGFIKLSIEKALDKLSVREKSVFVLRHYSELPFEEIGNILDLKSGTIRTLNFRAIKKLRKELYYYQNELQAGNING